MKKLMLLMGLMLAGVPAFATVQTKDNPDKTSGVYVLLDSQNVENDSDQNERFSTGYGPDGGDSAARDRNWWHYDHFWLNGIGGIGSFRSGRQVEHWGPPGGWTQDSLGQIVFDGSESDLGVGISIGYWNGVVTGVQTNGYALNIGNEHCGVKDRLQYGWDYFEEYGEYSFSYVSPYTRTAQTVLHLRTGGKAQSHQRNLWLLYGGAWEVLSRRAAAPFADAGMRDIPKTDIILGSAGAMGADGARWAVLPDGTDVDVTPMVKGKDFYAFSRPGAMKFKLHILANGYPLADDRVVPQAHYCVGQKINFQALFSPDVPGLNHSSPTWNYTADYVNNHWTDANGCEEYNIAPIPAMSNPTTAWFYNKQTQDATANLGLYCKFNNGQSVYLVRQGKFNVYTPIIQTWQPLYEGTPQVVVESGKLSLGSVSDTSGNAAGMSFAHYIQSNFSGVAGYTQLVTGEYDGNYSFPIAGYQLDNLEWPRGQNSIPVSEFGAQVAFDDGPSVSLATLNGITAMDLLFKSYLRFRPDAGAASDNIFVTLRLVTWGVTASATRNNGVWSVDAGSSSSGPYDSVNNDFPVWTETWHNILSSPQ